MTFHSFGQSIEDYYMHKSNIGLPTSSGIPNQSEIDMKELLLQISADNLSTKLDAIATLTVLITGDSYDKITLELVDNLTVSSVTLDGKTTTFNHTNDLLEIDCGSVQIDQVVDIKINYSGTPNPASEDIFSGINNAKSNAWGNQITYTLSEPFNAKVWWPAKQDLTDKIDRTRVQVTTTSNLKVGSNGLLKSTTNLSNDRVRYEWETNYPIVYYLVAFSIGEYVEHTNYAKPNALGGDSILIQNYIYNNPETLPHYQENLDRIPEMINIFSELFGLYPFHDEKYGHMMAPFSGGMEHQTMSSMGIFTFGLDAHELGHQWFGDHVTCGTWNDIWINEGFARFCEYMALEKILGTNRAAEVIEDDIFDVTSNQGGSVFIPADEELTDSRIFSYRMSYQKGALLINMLRNIVNNDALFFQSIRAYLELYGNSTATGEDFRAVLEQQTKIDFEDFFTQWYYGSGYPNYEITWTKLLGDSLGIQVNQSTTDTTPLFTTPLEFRIIFESGQTKILRLRQSQNNQYFEIGAQGKVKSLIFDPDKWLIKRMKSFNQLDENGVPILGLTNKFELDIFPNPATDWIKFKAPIDKIRIYDHSGKLLLKHEFTETESSLDIKKLQPGFYLIQAEVNEQLFTTKFYKK